jgi:hypothetical protein
MGDALFVSACVRSGVRFGFERCEQLRVTENMDGELEGTEATTASGNSIDATPAANGYHDMEDGHANGRT